jgi:A/G-specific adenine glycosylase
LIVSELDGRIPDTCADLLALPGIGEYAAAAIASIAFGEAVPAVDGNVLRVIARLRGIEDDIMLPETRRRVRAYLQPHIRRADPNAFNQSLMELGALVCRPRRPRCGVCPLARACVARRRDLTARIPAKSRAASGPDIAMVAGLIRSRGRLLLSRRPPAGLLGGLWELPAGPLPAGMAPAVAAPRVLREATGLTIETVGTSREIRHTFSHFRLALHVFPARRVAGRPRCGPGAAALRWVRPAELTDMPLTKTTRDALRR